MGVGGTLSTTATGFHATTSVLPVFTPTFNEYLYGGNALSVFDILLWWTCMFGGSVGVFWVFRGAHLFLGDFYCAIPDILEFTPGVTFFAMFFATGANEHDTGWVTVLSFRAHHGLLWCCG